MTFKAYNTWNNLVNRKQRSLDEQKRYLETWNKNLIEAKQRESEGKNTYIMGSKYWEREIKSTSKKIEKLEKELDTIMKNIPDDVQSEINQRDEIFITFSKLISFLEKVWNDRDEVLKKACDDWLDKEMKELKDSWYELSSKKRNEFREMKAKTEYNSKEKDKFMDKLEMENYIIPRNKLLDKAGFHEISEYVRVSSKSIESLKKENLEDAQQSVLNLVSRVEDKVGKITDWSGIHFGSNGMLNGRVTGTCGSTYVETIGAGGYNIQKFHYRVILKK